MSLWRVSHKADPVGAKIADGHYSRRKIGSPQFMPPGDTLVLVRDDAVFGWWRANPASGIAPMNGLYGWTCSIFRNAAGTLRSSALILEAEIELVRLGKGCGPDGMLTYVFDRKVQSPNPGYCFKCAGWRPHPNPERRRSWDGRKSLLWKPFELAGVAACGVNSSASSD
jgi:hypothetical protein